MKIVFFLALLTLAKPSQAQWLGSAEKIEITPDITRQVYLAGFGSKGRKATGIHNPLWARGIAVSDGKQAVVFVALDLIGFARPYVEKIRTSFIEKESGSKISPPYILISSVHTHSGPDTLGLWGPKTGISGVDPAYMTEVTNKVTYLIAHLLAHMEPVKIYAASSSIPIEGIVRDLRDPVVIDNKLSMLQLENAKNNQTIGTLVNWACHPEVLGEENTLITSDYAGSAANHIEDKMDGTAIFLSGAIGGMMSPDNAQDTFEEAERIGKSLSEYAYEMIRRETPIEGTSMQISTTSLKLPIENNLYLAMLAQATHGRPLYNKKGNLWKFPYWSSWPPLARPFLSWIDTKLLAGNIPYLETEIGLIQIGNASFLSIPGELFPELAIGGYKGEHRFHYPLVNPKNERPPSLSNAPEGPYLKELMPGKFHFLIGLANDEIGYIVPEYDFKINALSPIHLPKPKGHHYEETNSLGKEASRRLLEAMTKLLSEIKQK